MRFSTRARYALWMMLEVARSTDGRTVSLADVAKKTQISRRYLEQLATALKHARLLRGRTGRGGGFEITRPAAEVRLREVIEAAIGPVNIVECVTDPHICLKADVCECRWVYATINERIVELLDTITLADLADEAVPQRFLSGQGSLDTPCPILRPVDDEVSKGSIGHDTREEDR